MPIIELTQASFDKVLDQNDLLVIDFWAKWCAPCKVFAKVFGAVAKRFPDVSFASVDIEKEPKLAEDFNIRSLPFLMVLRKDVAVYADSGALPEQALVDLIEQAQKLKLEDSKPK